MTTAVDRIKQVTELMSPLEEDKLPADTIAKCEQILDEILSAGPADPDYGAALLLRISLVDKLKSSLEMALLNSFVK